MKSIVRKLAASAVAAIAIVTTLPESKAADVTIDGSGFYELSTTIGYYPSGLRQTGRRPYLGAGEYHKAIIGSRWMSNNSNVRSGTLSFEFWAMPFYGASRGIVLMNSGIPGIAPKRFYNNPRRSGFAVFLNRYRFPELNLYEYTRTGWQFRDTLTFRRKNLL